jgi:hypothetical protein
VEVVRDDLLKQTEMIPRPFVEIRGHLISSTKRQRRPDQSRVLDLHLWVTVDIQTPQEAAHWSFESSRRGGELENREQHLVRKLQFDEVHGDIVAIETEVGEEVELGAEVIRNLTFGLQEIESLRVFGIPELRNFPRSCVATSSSHGVRCPEEWSGTEGGRGGGYLRLMVEARTTREFSVTLRDLPSLCFPFRLKLDQVGGRERERPWGMDVAEGFERNFFREVKDPDHAVGLVISHFPRKCKAWESIRDERVGQDGFTVLWDLRNVERSFGPLHRLCVCGVVRARKEEGVPSI